MSESGGKLMLDRSRCGGKIQPSQATKRATTGSKNMTTTLTANETQALDSLRANAEGFSQTTIEGTWAGVYLNNAKPAGWNGHAWASVLGSLERKGLYRVDDGDAFGLVLVAN